MADPGQLEIKLPSEFMNAVEANASAQQVKNDATMEQGKPGYVAQPNAPKSEIKVDANKSREIQTERTPDVQLEGVEKSLTQPQGQSIIGDLCGAAMKLVHDTVDDLSGKLPEKPSEQPEIKTAQVQEVERTMDPTPENNFTGPSPGPGGGFA